MKLTSRIFLLGYYIILLFGMTACADNANTTVSVQPVSVADVERFGTAMEIVKRYYVESVPDKKLFDDAIRGLIDGLDPHSTYLDENDLKTLQATARGQFSGLGIEVMPANGFLKVITPIDGGPAQKAGIQPGDYIIKINGVLVNDMTLPEAIKQMRGVQGSLVTLTLIRDKLTQPITLKLVRSIIKLVSVKSKLLSPGYAYIRISNFQENTVAALSTAIQKFQASTTGPLKGLILDVRNNPGGLLEPAVQVTDLFLSANDLTNNQVIVSAKGRYPEADFVIKARPSNIIPGVPMIVLINQGSASGAEIVAGALQDYKRAIVVGTESFGKGSVQTVIPLDKKTAIKLTTALYYTPSGRSIQASGIQPDIVVADPTLPSKDAPAAAVQVIIKEIDLKGHLTNGNKTALVTLPNAMVTPAITALTNVAPGAPFASEDYQLAAAFNILKGLTAHQ